MSGIHRFEIPVDSAWHTINSCSVPLHVACRIPTVVEFWAWESVLSTGSYEYRVYATGESIPQPCVYIGTAIAPSGQFVWHLVRRL